MPLAWLSRSPRRRVRSDLFRMLLGRGPLCLRLDLRVLEERSDG